tara:strand:+ start:564 stop:1217 length:654 start_codon:yes stop_codon:yes gene_type:complete
MKVTINIPESLSEITLLQYQKWLKINESNEDDNFLKQKMVEIFCNIPLNEVLSIKANDINNIVEDINTIFLLEPKFKDRFIYNGVEFGFIPKLDDMSFGEYIDLDTYLPDWQQMHKAINVLYRPIKYSKKEKYLIEEYESADKYDMKNVTLDIVFGSLVFFWNLKKELLNHILKYLANQEEVNLPHQKLDLMKNGLGISQYMDWHKVMSGDLMKSLI